MASSQFWQGQAQPSLELVMASCHCCLNNGSTKDEWYASNSNSHVCVHARASTDDDNECRASAHATKDRGRGTAGGTHLRRLGKSGRGGAWNRRNRATRRLRATGRSARGLRGSQTSSACASRLRDTRRGKILARQMIPRCVDGGRVEPTPVRPVRRAECTDGRRLRQSVRRSRRSSVGAGLLRSSRSIG